MADKYHQLASLMKHMLSEIDQHSEEVGRSLNFVQFHFYEKKIIIGRPPLTKKAFKEMTNCHYIGLQHFSPSTRLKQICATIPWGMSAIIGQGIILSGHVLPRQTVGYFVPWGVYITIPEANKQMLQENRQQTLLLCPSAEEVPSIDNRFEKEHASNSFTHQLLTVGAHVHENKILTNNLQQHPHPLYEQAKKDWMEHSQTDDIAKKPRNLNKTVFAPQLGQTIEGAYIAVIKSTRNRTSKHRQNLRLRYQRKLERHIFKNLGWTPQEKMAFLED